MNRVLRWLLMAAGLVIVLLAGGVFGLHAWVGSNDFRMRVAREISSALGVPVELGGLSVEVFPLPGVAVDRVQVKSNPPLSFEHIEARPVWAALLQKKLAISTLYVRNAVVPQDAIAAVTTAFRKVHPEDKAAKKPAEPSQSVSLPERIVLEKVTWVDTKGGRNVVDATSHMDSDGLPGRVEFAVVDGRWKGIQLKLDRRSKGWIVDGKLG